MPERLFDRLLFGWARLDSTIPTGPFRLTQRRDIVDLLNVRDPPSFRDEAVATLYELLNLDIRGHSCLHDGNRVAALRAQGKADSSFASIAASAAEIFEPTPNMPPAAAATARARSAIPS
jgi:hypothetical protein